MRTLLRGALLTGAVIGGIVGFGLAYAAIALALASAEPDPCDATYDPDMCRVERSADDPLPPLPCFVPCDTDTRCEEQAERCDTI